MYNRKELNEACDYLIENYKGMKDILSHDDPYIPKIVWNVYRFKKLEDYGFSLEDFFMYTYECIIIKESNGESISNITEFIQTRIIIYFASETKFASAYNFIHSLGSIEDKVKNLSFRKVEDYDFNDDIDYSASAFVDDIIDRIFVKQLIDNSNLTERELHVLDKYYITQISMKEIGDSSYIFPLTAGRISEILAKGMKKMRYVCKYRLHYSPDEE
jgi:hypothetical protein